MNIEEIRDFCLSLNEVDESFPFGPTTLVFKTTNKMFLLIGLDNFETSFNVKCDPEKAIELREHYPNSILPGYHMNKKHWNTIVINGELKRKQVEEFIIDSYNLVNK